MIGLGLVFALAAPAAAQGTAASGGPLLAAGFTVITGDPTAPGFGVNIAVPIRTTGNAALGIVGDFGWNRASVEEVSTTLMTFQGGVRFTFTGNEKFSPFGQFVAGIARSAVPDFDFSSTDLVFTPGGGVDIRLNDKISFRGAVDFLILRFSEEGFSETSTDTRLFLGISMALGGG